MNLDLKDPSMPNIFRETGNIPEILSGYPEKEQDPLDVTETVKEEADYFQSPPSFSMPEVADQEWSLEFLINVLATPEVVPPTTEKQPEISVKQEYHQEEEDDEFVVIVEDEEQELPFPVEQPVIQPNPPMIYPPKKYLPDKKIMNKRKKNEEDDERKDYRIHTVPILNHKMNKFHCSVTDKPRERMETDERTDYVISNNRILMASTSISSRKKRKKRVSSSPKILKTFNWPSTRNDLLREILNRKTSKKKLTDITNK